MEYLPSPTKTAPWGISQSVGKAVSSNRASLIKYAEFNITGRCEGGCITCHSTTSYPDEKTVKTESDLERESEMFKEILRKLKGFGLEFLTIYGREPTLWDKEAKEPNAFLGNLISWASKDLGVKVCLAVSGMNLNEEVVRTLFDNRGILFMKKWGSERSIKELMKGKDAYTRSQNSWALVKRVRKDYKEVLIMAEFLYTGINREDLLSFWRDCLSSNILPFVETPVIAGHCIKSQNRLGFDLKDYVKDIYNLSILNLSLLYGLSEEEAKETDLWYPPYGSCFPVPCDRWTKGKGIFIERNGDISPCNGVSFKLGNIHDSDIKEKLLTSQLYQNIRTIDGCLEGQCGNCDYSSKLKVCYGCRGNAFTYETSTKGIFGEDPLCFLAVAKKMDEKYLRTFMHPNHIKRLMGLSG